VATARASRVTTAFRASGPPRVVARAAAAAVALPLPLPGFGRTPGPVFRPRPRPVPAPAPSREKSGGLARRAGWLVISLPDRPLLDRVVRGRAWIPLLGVLLAGIVAMQVEILKLGASMGRSLEQTSTLTNQNEQLRGSVAGLADDQRIEQLAGAMGMVLPPPGAVGYLVADAGGNVAGALANLHAPDSSSFVMLTPKNGALVTGEGTSTLPPTPGAPPPATTTSTSPGTSPTTVSTTTPSSSSSSTGAPTTTGSGASGTSGAATGSTTGQATGQASGASTGAVTTSGTPTDTQATTPASGGATNPQQGTGAATQAPATGAAAIQPSSQSGGGG